MFGNREKEPQTVPDWDPIGKHHWKTYQKARKMMLEDDYTTAMKIKQYDEVLLKDGRTAAIVEVFSERDFLVDVGSSPADWDTISVTIHEIEKVLKKEVRSVTSMKQPIGFKADFHNEKDYIASCPNESSAIVPRKSLVQVHFPARNMTLSYYNDQFDLHRGDLVFVDGKLEGLRGRVVDITYSFKIKLSDYKRVVAVADTNVSGEFFLAGSHFVSFDEDAIPFKKVITWFRAPLKPEEEVVAGYDDTFFDLEHLEDMGVSNAIADRGFNYYCDNKVVYISVSGAGIGCAIVEGSEPYIVEFEYNHGSISNLTCSCFCSYPCKHQSAAMLQLKETLERIMRHYKEQYGESEYFAAISKPVFMTYAVDGKEIGSFKI